VALVIHLTTMVAGVSEFAVRVGMVVLGVGTVALAYRAGALLAGRLAGWFCLLAAATCPLFVLLSGFAAPDGPLLFLWAATVYAVLLAVKTGRGRYWYTAGVLLGLALLAKYVAILLVPSVFLVALASPRAWLRRREPYLAGLLALLVFSPNLWWNLHHGWVSMSFQLAHGACQAGSSAADHLSATVIYAVTQASIVGPLLAALLGAGTVAAAVRGIRCRQDSLLLLACCTLVISLLFFAAHGLAHWAAPAYFSAIVCGGVFLARLLRRLPPLRRLLLLSACVVALLATGIESVYVVHTVAEGAAMPGPLGEMIEPTLVEPALRWRDVGRHVDATLAGLQHEERRPVVLLADTYGTAAEVAFYTASHPRVYSASNEYGIWGLPPAPSTPGTVLFVGNAGVLETVHSPLSRSSRPAATVTVRSGGRVVRRLQTSVLPPVAPAASRVAIAGLLAAAWHRAATLCEGS
jgi:dolichol-phosphate mannosyltransferase